jgi:hypothetical protein
MVVDYIEKHSTKPWVWDEIHMNPFTKEKNEFMMREYRRHLSALKIQKWYHHISTTISYAFCKKRVNMFYDKEFINKI